MKEISERPVALEARLADALRSLGSSSGAGLGPTATLYAVLAGVAVLVNNPGTYVGDNRFEEYWSPGSRLLRQLFIWDGTRDLGGIREDLWPSTIVVGLLRGVGLSPAWAEHVFHGLLVFLAGLGVAALVRHITGRTDAVVVIAGLAYMFGPFSATFLLPSALYLAFVITPWLLLCFVWGVRVVSGSPRPPAWRAPAGAALLVFAVGTTDPPGLFYALVLLLPTAVYLVHVERSATWRSVAGWSLRAGGLSLLAGAAVLAKVLIGSEAFAGRLGYTESPRFVNVTSSWAESWRGLGFWLNYFRDESGLVRDQFGAYVANPYVIIATFAVPTAALAALWRSRWRPRLLFAAIAVTALVVMVGTYPIAGPSPYGRLVRAAYERYPWSAGLRTTFKAGPGVALGVAVLFASAVVLAVRALPSARRLGGAALAAAVLVTAGYPFWTGNLYSPDTELDAVPVYWRDALHWLDEQPGDGRVLVLPGSTVTPYRWGWPGDDIFDALLRRPHAAASALRSGGAEAADVLAALSGRVGKDYRPGTFGPIARRLGIAWVLIRNDVDWQRTAAPRPVDFDALRADPALVPAASFGPPGRNTVAPQDRALAVFNELKMPPVQIYAVRDAVGPLRVERDVAPLLVAGSGEAWPQMADRGLLQTAAPVRYTAGLAPSELTTALRRGSLLTISDTNRRRLTLLRGTSTTSSHTLGAGENLEPGRRTQELFDRPGSQTVATFGDARRITASGLQTLAGFQPWWRPANAFDGDARTSWLTGAFDPRPEGAVIHVDLRAPTRLSSVELDVAQSPTLQRRVSRAEVRFSDGSSVQVPLDSRQGQARFRERTVRWFEVRITGVDGPGLDPVGFSEIRVPGLDLGESLQVPDDVFRAAASDRRLRTALDAAPVAYQFRRERGTGPEDEELRIRRRFRTVGERGYRASGELHLTTALPDQTVDALLGDEVGAYGSSRVAGLLENRGGQAVDGRLDSGWVAEAVAGQTLTVRFPERVIDRVEVAAPAGDFFSHLREVAVTVGGERRTVSLAPVDCPAASATAGPCREVGVATFPTVSASHLTVEATAIDPVQTEQGPKPLAILEVTFAPGANQAPPADGRAGTACRSGLLSLDGEDIPVRIDATRADVFAGAPLPYVSCDDRVLRAGRHTFDAEVGVDTALLEAGPTTELPGLAAGAPPVTVDRISATHQRVQVTTTGPAVLLSGESFAAGWEATMDGRRLATASSLDTQSGWRLPTAGVHTVDLRFRPQRIYNGALLASLAGVAVCAALVLWRRRRD